MLPETANVSCYNHGVSDRTSFISNCNSNGDKVSMKSSQMSVYEITQKC